MDVLQHYARIRDRFLGDAHLLIEEGRDASAMLLLCGFIDTAGRYHLGRIEDRAVRASFRAFVERFMPALLDVSFPELLFECGQSRDVVDLMFYCHRHGLLHEGELPRGIRLVRHKGSGLGAKVYGAGTMELNIHGIFNYVLHASCAYEQLLAGDSHARAAYQARLAFQSKRRFKKPPARKHAAVGA